MKEGFSMSEAERARGMLHMAEKDLNAIKAMKNPQTFATEIFGFHAQQAIEKALKAWLAFLHCEFPLTHNIVGLLAELEGQGADVGAFWDLVKFNTFAVQFRYEPYDEVDTDLDRDAVIVQVTSLISHVKMLSEKE